MSFTELIYWTGDVAYESFKLLEAGGNNVNYMFMAIGAISCVLWVKRMAQYNAEAEQNGTIK